MMAGKQKDKVRTSVRFPIAASVLILLTQVYGLVEGISDGSTFRTIGFIVTSALAVVMVIGLIIINSNMWIRVDMVRE